MNFIILLLFGLQYIYTLDIEIVDPQLEEIEIKPFNTTVLDLKEKVKQADSGSILETSVYSTKLKSQFSIFQSLTSIKTSEELVINPTTGKVIVSWYIPNDEEEKRTIHIIDHFTSSLTEKYIKTNTIVNDTLTVA